ncbi:MAG: glycosyltransferase [Chromatiales bacterium]|nr:glycosyltransferase [Chromatiales bacterium]
MRVCLVTYGKFPDPSGVVAGNSVRGHLLARGLLAHGIGVDWLYPAFLDRENDPKLPSTSNIRVYSYADTADLLSRIDGLAPDVVLVGYWEMLEHFPENYARPIVVDVVAPRILESLYENGRDLSEDVTRLTTLYRRADLFICGTERQRHFLLPWLILAGFDCREQVPSIVIPISVEPAEHPLVPPTEPEPWRFVTGGVHWPWRRTRRWIDALEHEVRALDGRAHLELLSGRYVYAPDRDQAAVSDARQSAFVTEHALKPYGEMQGFLRGCHVGLELADRNTEREYSQSFRAMEFLRQGLPLICNRFLEIAEHIDHADAGWIVDDPAELSALVRRIITDPSEWTRRSNNALALADERFHFARTVEPLIAYLRAPARPARGNQPLGHRPEPVSPAETQPGESTQSTPPLTPMQAGQVDGLPRKHTLIRRLAQGAGAVLRRLAPGRSAGVITITRDDIDPPDHGAAVKIDRTAWALSLQLGHTWIVTERRDRYFEYTDGVRSERRFPFWLRWLGPDRRRVHARLTAAGIPADNAFLYAPLHDWSFILRTVYVALRHGARRYLAEFPAYARAGLWARRMLGGRLMIAEHNVEYQRLHEQYPSMPELGYEIARLSELFLCGAADAVIAVSDRDLQTLAAAGVPRERLRMVPHGVDLDAFDQAVPLDLQTHYAIEPGTPVLVYHGIYGYPPNLEAMQVFAKEILPRIHARGLRPKVLAIGRHPPARPLHEDIIFTGSLPALAPVLRAAQIAVVPLMQGGGTRMKVLDYFAANLPVISTSKGVEGLPVRDGREVVVRDDFGAFAAAVVDLVQNPDQARKIAAKGRALVERLDWREIGAQYVRAFDQSRAGNH